MWEFDWFGLVCQHGGGANDSEWLFTVIWGEAKWREARGLSISVFVKVKLIFLSWEHEWFCGVHCVIFEIDLFVPNADSIGCYSGGLLVIVSHCRAAFWFLLPCLKPRCNLASFNWANVMVLGAVQHSIMNFLSSFCRSLWRKLLNDRKVQISPRVSLAGLSWTFFCSILLLFDYHMQRCSLIMVI